MGKTEKGYFGQFVYESLNSFFAAVSVNLWRLFVLECL